MSIFSFADFYKLVEVKACCGSVLWARSGLSNQSFAVACSSIGCAKLAYFTGNPAETGMCLRNSGGPVAVCSGFSSSQLLLSSRYSEEEFKCNYSNAAHRKSFLILHTIALQIRGK